MSIKFERKLPLIFFGVAVLLTLVGFTFYNNTRSIRESIVWQKETQTMLSKLDEVQSLATNIDLAVNSYIITTNSTYLDPVARHKAKLEQNLTEISMLAAGYPSVNANVKTLRDIVAEKNTESERLAQLMKTEGHQTALGEIPKQSSRILTEKLRAVIERLKSDQLAALQAREQWLDNNLNSTIWILIVSSTAALIALIIANFSVFSEMKRRRTAEDEIIEANKNLELRINERTLELSEANKNLSEIAAERKQLLSMEQAARNEAEAANRHRDEFMATVSHELRTPLNSILGWARLMRNGGLKEDQQERAVETIIRSSEAQNRLIDDLLDVARIISGKLELEMEEVVLSDVLQSAVEAIRPSADAKGIAVSIDIIGESHECLVKGDPNRIGQIFSNLLTNAVKFTNKDGEIKVVMDCDENDYVIEFIDSGVGISQDVLPYIFERYKQGMPTNRTSGGLGLGLAIVKNLVDLHGGKIEAFSDGADTGTKFVVTFPRCN